MFEVAGYIRPSFCMGDKPEINLDFKYDVGTIGNVIIRKNHFY